MHVITTSHQQGGEEEDKITTTGHIILNYVAESSP